MKELITLEEKIALLDDYVLPIIKNDSSKLEGSGQIAGWGFVQMPRLEEEQPIIYAYDSTFQNSEEWRLYQAKKYVAQQLSVDDLQSQEAQVIYLTNYLSTNSNKIRIQQIIFAEQDSPTSLSFKNEMLSLVGVAHNIDEQNPIKYFLIAKESL